MGVVLCLASLNYTVTPLCNGWTMGVTEHTKRGKVPIFTDLVLRVASTNRDGPKATATASSGTIIIQSACVSTYVPQNDS